MTLKIVIDKKYLYDIHNMLYTSWMKKNNINLQPEYVGVEKIKKYNGYYIVSSSDIDPVKLTTKVIIVE